MTDVLAMSYFSPPCRKHFMTTELGYLVSYLPCIVTLLTSFLHGTVGLLRWHGLKSSWQTTAQGNLKGDGTLLGGTMVIGTGDQGILFQHQSREFGDRADLDQILAAVQKINKINS